MSGAASKLGLSGRFIREVVAYENQTTGGFFRVEVRTVQEENLQVTICAVPCLLLKFFVYSQQDMQTETIRDQKTRQVVEQKSIKPSAPKSGRGRLITGGGRLRQVSTVRLKLGKFWCFGWVVAYQRFQLQGFDWGSFGVLDRWSLTRGSNYRASTGEVLVFWIGGRLREVVAHVRQTVVVINRFTGQVKSSRSQSLSSGTFKE